MVMPPIAPIIRIGAYALVISAAGRLSNKAKSSPTAQPGQSGKVIQPMTSPMANRLMKAASNAVRLSGNDIGSIIATEAAPKMKPLIRPDIKFDIRLSI